MRFLAFLCLIGVANAFYWGIKNQWMFKPTDRGGHWWIGDAGVGLVCFFLGLILLSIISARSRSHY
jgi:hypothetical protein